MVEDIWLLQDGLPRQPLEEMLEPEMARQYRLNRGEQCKFVPVLEGSRWLCSCGEENDLGEVCACGLKLELLTWEAMEALSRETTQRLEQEAAEKAAEEARLAREKAIKKRKKRLCLTAIAALVLCLGVGIYHLAVHWFIPAGHYSDAKAALARQDYETAYREFYLAGDWEDAQQQLDRFTVLVAREESKAKELLKVSTYTYDEQGREIRAVHTTSLPDGGGGFVASEELVWESSFDEQDRAVQITDMTGRNVYYYGDRDAVSVHARYRVADDEPLFLKSYTYEYDDQGRMTYCMERCSDYATVNYSYEVASTWAYDGEGRVKEQTMAVNYPATPESGYRNHVVWEYNEKGDPISRTVRNENPIDPNDVGQIRQTWVYDDQGRQIGQTTQSTFALDPYANSLEELVSVLDADGRLLEERVTMTYENAPERNYQEYQAFTYDEEGRTLTEFRSQTYEDATINAIGGYVEEGRRTYDSQGNLLTYTFYHSNNGGGGNPSGMEVGYTYDAWGRLTAQRTVRKGGGAESTELQTFGDNGLLQTKTTTTGKTSTVTSYEYVFFYE